MDDLLRDFVIETHESLDILDVELVHFERDPANQPALEKIFRLVHTIKGTCGFLNLPRLESLAHAVEGPMSQFRDGGQADSAAVTLVLSALDRIKLVVATLEKTGREPPGDDAELIAALGLRLASGASNARQQDVDSADAPERERHQGAAPDQTDAPSPDLTAGSRDMQHRKTGASVRVAVERLDQLMTMASELVLVRNQLLDVARRDPSAGYKLPLQRLSAITSELQDGVMRTRMHAVGAAWSNMPRIARDLSLELGKDIEIQASGGDTEIDRQLLEVIKDSIVHLVRNSADHGIEPQALRITLNKPGAGLIALSARQEGSLIIIEVSDDGRGIDAARLRNRALDLGLIDQATHDRMNDADAAQLIFRSGFSTASEITSLSGRGVGLDAVKSHIERAGGTVEIDNRPGEGLRIILKLPLTLAIAAVLIVEAGGCLYALPQLSIRELVRAQDGSEIRIEQVGDGLTLRLRDQLLPLLGLADTLATGAADIPAGGVLAICQFGAQRFALAVDAVLHSEEIVVKPMASRFRQIEFFSGAAILGDGSVVLILDPGGFARLAAREAGTAHASAPLLSDRAAPIEQTPLLQFRSQNGAESVVPLALVARLDEVDGGQFETVAGKVLIRQQGRLTQIHGLDADALPASGVRQSLIMFSHGGASAGMAVSEILDVIDATLDPYLGLAGEGSMGSVVINDRTMHLLDVEALFTSAMAAARGQVQNARPVALLLEADAFLAAMLKPVLTGAGYLVRLAATPAEAMRMLESCQPGCAVIDLDTAGEGGLDLARALRRAGGARIVGTATLPSQSLGARARAAGLSACVGKFDRRALLAALGETAAIRDLAA